MPVVEEIRRFLAMALAWRTDFRAIGRNAQVALHERAHRYCCRKATDKPKRRRQLRSPQPPSQNKSFPVYFSRLSFLYCFLAKRCMSEGTTWLIRSHLP